MSVDCTLVSVDTLCAPDAEQNVRPFVVARILEHIEQASSPQLKPAAGRAPP